MRFLIILTLMLFFCLVATAADRITATITITNAPTTNGMTVVVNADTRTWTNNVVTPASQILTNNSIGGITTNYWFQINANPYAGGLQPLWIATNQVGLVGTVGGALAVSFAGNYAAVSYTTQAVSALLTVRVPLSAETAAVRTNIASLLAAGIGQFATNGPTNMTLYTPKLSSPTMTNGVNYGNAFISPGPGIFSTQIGGGASSLGNSSVAVGDSALANGTYSVALGRSASAAAENSVALGSAAANSTNSTAVGSGASATGTNTVAIGTFATVTHDNSTAIGANSATTRTNQVMLGSASYQVNVPGYLTGGAISNMIYSGTIGNLTNGTLAGTIVTNGTFYGTLGALSGGQLAGGSLKNYALTNVTSAGTNIFGGIIRYPRFSSAALANGNNAAVDAGTNVYLRVSTGPTAAFAICGIAGGADGRYLIVVNRTGQNMTIANDSGVDPTPANRIYTLTGSDAATTADGAATLIYDSTDSRWHLISLQQ